MSETQRIFSWVTAYGGWEPTSRHPLEIFGHDRYISGVADALAAFGNRLGTVYVSGGRRDEDGDSECDTFIPELRERLENRGVTDANIRADEESVTAISIAKAFLRTWQAEFPSNLPVLFVDEVRLETNAYILEEVARSLNLAIDPYAVLVPLRRLDTHPHSTAEHQLKKRERIREIGLDAAEAEEIAKITR